ncbi:MAG: hypothetical protein ACJ8FP_22940, partial [Xanthobacteraceae bacterium]
MARASARGGGGVKPQSPRPFYPIGSDGTHEHLRDVVLSTEFEQMVLRFIYLFSNLHSFKLSRVFKAGFSHSAISHATAACPRH